LRLKLSADLVEDERSPSGGGGSAARRSSGIGQVLRRLQVVLVVLTMTIFHGAASGFQSEGK
jgi:hypothetical protein